MHDLLQTAAAMGVDLPLLQIDEVRLAGKTWHHVKCGAWTVSRHRNKPAAQRWIALCTT